MGLCDKGDMSLFILLGGDILSMAMNQKMAKPTKNNDGSAATQFRLRLRA